MIKIILLIVIFTITLWSIWGYFSSRVEQAEYKVIKQLPAYEIRRYAPHIEAQTTVQGPQKKALNDGFRIIASYIFGNNERKNKVAMTAPVIAQAVDDTHIISFIMPRNYMLKTLPHPNDSRIKLVEVPEKTVAAMRFSGYYTDNRIQNNKEKLAIALKADGIVTIGGPYFAGYNPPWTPPWMMRNEVFYEIAMP